MVRCFIAVYPIENRIVRKLVPIIENIKNFVIGKAVEEENFHITLSFLGEISDTQLIKIREELKRLANNLKKAEITIGNIKFIPDSNFIRVIALDVSGLEKISEEIEKNVGGDVKPAHLTLFRVKNIINKNGLIEFCKKVNFEERMKVESIKLMKSTLTKSGSIYEILESFPLLQEI